GLTRTVWIGAALNVAIASIVWIGQRWAPPEAQEARVQSPTADHEALAATVNDTTVRRVLMCFALSGVAALSYEVIWTRALTFFIGNSIYAFSAMLTTFLCGLAIGSLLCVRWADRQQNPLAAVGSLQVAIGVYGLLSIAILGRLFYGLDT